ncbi:MAG: hypothetical protein JW715_10345 [Sedimentisphaerales bacterium]|nr:hypothetical protein [Sedimentisphaerales bacterium]
MKLNEIKKKREELASILREENAESKLEKLQKLAKEVGASVTRIEKVEKLRDTTGVVKYESSNEITESEIVHNIQESLQTETMIEMCRISNRNFWVALSATVIALLAMIAAWTAAIA